MALIRKSRIFLSSRVFSCQSLQNRRTFLSDQFNLRADWNERLKAPVFSNIDMDKYFIDIDRQYTKTGIISHIDMDVFANALLISREHGQINSEQDIESRCEQVEELLRRFNRTPQVVKRLESTPHAVVRACVDMKETEFLISILNNRLKFGLIMDDFCASLLCDHFIKAGNFRDASKVGILMMLQEEYTIPMASEMSLWSIFKFLTLKGEDLVWDPRPPVVEPEPEDEVQIRVDELENPYFDDHFDLTQKEHLLGKTLAKLSQNQTDKIVRDSLQLLGYSLYEKWDKVSSLLAANNEFDGECVEVVKGHVSEAQNSEMEAKLSGLKLANANVEKVLEDQVKTAVHAHESKLVESQARVYKAWNEKRDEELHMQYKQAQQAAKMQEFEQSKIKIGEDEERLFFFDNYEQMEKGKRAKFAEWRRTWPRRTWAPQIKFGLRDPNVPLVTRKEKQLAKLKQQAAKK